MNKYIVIDVETANSDVSSICQIGLAFFENGSLVKTWESLINPQCRFDGYNTHIHGITESDVTNSPTILQAQDEILSFFEENTICSYTFFDHRALSKHLDLSPYKWIDITLAVRRIWSEFSQKGYGLKNICRVKKIKLNHHNALSDAIAAGEILNLISLEHSMSFEQIASVTTEIKRYKTAKAKDFQANDEGQWLGEFISFTGSLSISRNDAMKIASEAGFNCLSGVTKQTSFLVKGQQDLGKLAGSELSAKEKKALKLVDEGQPITFISENDFFSMLNESK